MKSPEEKHKGVLKSTNKSFAVKPFCGDVDLHERSLPLFIRPGCSLEKNKLIAPLELGVVRF